MYTPPRQNHVKDTRHPYDAIYNSSPRLYDYNYVIELKGY